jgi:hypothetical protein
MEAIANREEELSIIDEAVTTLLDRKRLLRTPIVEFYGIEGIGKTTLLTKVREQYRNQKQLSYVWTDIKENPSYQFVQTAKTLLADNKPVVVIVDSLDTASKDLLREIEESLSELVQSNDVFIVLASRYIQSFENTRSIARKLTLHPLRPLERESCISYLRDFASRIPPDTRDMIFDWTRGYPLAMTVITDAILNQQLDFSTDQNKKRLVEILMEKVINKNLLADVTAPEVQNRLQTLLALFSIPRRFNLILMQDLIKKFAPQYELKSSLAYLTLPSDINKVTSVLNWSMERAGYCIEAPIRNLFLLKYRIEQTHQYVEIHIFLAEKNLSFAGEVTGSDHSRYLREFFYHLAFSENEALVRENLTQQIERLAQLQTQERRNLLPSLESFLQFYEEFQQDIELKEALGQRNASFASSLIYRNIIEIYRQLPEKERGNWLRSFFSLVTHQPQSEDFALIFIEGMRQIIQQVSRDESIKLYNDLIQDEELKILLGEKFNEATKHVFAELLRDSE